MEPINAGIDPSTGTPCVWTLSAVEDTDDTSVVGLPNQTISSTVQWIKDPTVGTTLPDTLELTVRVWYTNDLGSDSNTDRVLLRTLRTP